MFYTVTDRDITGVADLNLKLHVLRSSLATVAPPAAGDESEPRATVSESVPGRLLVPCRTVTSCSMWYYYY